MRPSSNILSNLETSRSMPYVTAGARDNRFLEQIFSSSGAPSSASDKKQNHLSPRAITIHTANSLSLLGNSESSNRELLYPLLHAVHLRAQRIISATLFPCSCDIRTQDAHPRMLIAKLGSRRCARYMILLDCAVRWSPSRIYLYTRMCAFV